MNPGLATGPIPDGTRCRSPMLAGRTSPKPSSRNNPPRLHPDCAERAPQRWNPRFPIAFSESVSVNLKTARFSKGRRIIRPPIASGVVLSSRMQPEPIEKLAKTICSPCVVTATPFRGRPAGHAASTDSKPVVGRVTDCITFDRVDWIVGVDGRRPCPDAPFRAAGRCRTCCRTRSFPPSKTSMTSTSPGARCPRGARSRLGWALLQPASDRYG
jgi:hypothetical protein